MSTDTKNEARGSYRDLRNVPGLWALIVSTTLARSALRMYQVLIVLFVLATFKSSALAGLVVLSTQVPGILFSPIAGALLDRAARSLLMATDYVVAGLAVALILILSLLHCLPIGALVAVALFGSITQPLSSSGGRSLMPLIVPTELWHQANALDSSTYVVSTVAGPATAGIAVAIVGVHWALLVPVIAWVAAAVCLTRVRPPRTVRDTPIPILEDAKGAIRYVFSNPVLRQLALTVGMFGAASAAVTIAVPVLVLHRLHGGSLTSGFMIATLGFAGFVSSVAYGFVRAKGHERAYMIASCIIEGVGLLAVALVTRHEVLDFAALAFAGLSTGPFVVTTFTLRQHATDPKWYGRAFAVAMNLNFASFPIAAAIVGVIVGHSVPWAFVFLAALGFGAAAWSAIFPFEVRQHDGDASPKSTVTATGVEALE